MNSIETVEEGNGREVEEFVVELKELPTNLKYVFLGEQMMQPTITNNSLTSLDEEKLMTVLR